MKRADGRKYDELRPVEIITGYQSFAEGSALIKLGKTHVLCSVSVEERVPPFLKGSGTGWITAEYAMLPRATVTRSQRDSALGRVGGRNQEIQRLIGRSLRAVADLGELGERTLIVDCDVIQADGGTRTAAITGAYVALHQALETLANMGVISSIPLKSAVAATSVGTMTCLTQHSQAQCQPIIREIQLRNPLSCQFSQDMQPLGNPVSYPVHTMRMLRQYMYQPDGDDPPSTQTFPIAVRLYHLIDDRLYACLL